MEANPPQTFCEKSKIPPEKDDGNSVVVGGWRDSLQLSEIKPICGIYRYRCILQVFFGRMEWRNVFRGGLRPAPADMPATAQSHKTVSDEESEELTLGAPPGESIKKFRELNN